MKPNDDKLLSRLKDHWSSQELADERLFRERFDARKLAAAIRGKTNSLWWSDWRKWAAILTMSGLVIFVIIRRESDSRSIPHQVVEVPTPIESAPDLERARGDVGSSISVKPKYADGKIQVVLQHGIVLSGDLAFSNRVQNKVTFTVVVKGESDERDEITASGTYEIKTTLPPETAATKITVGDVIWSRINLSSTLVPSPSKPALTRQPEHLSIVAEFNQK